MKLVRGYRRLNDLLERLLLAAASAVMIFIVLAIFIAAATRYVTGVGYDWLAELPPQFVPWVVFPLLGVLLRRGQHLSVDLIPYFISERGAIVINMIVAAVCFATSATFFMAGVDAIDFFRMLNEYSTTEIRYPLWWLYLAFPAGFLIAANFSFEMLLVSALRMAGGAVESTGESDVHP